MANKAHGTLTASSVTSLTIDSGNALITVTNRTQTGELWFTVDGGTPAVADPGSFICLGSRTVQAPNMFGTTTVKLFSTAALAYSVVGETS